MPRKKSAFGCLNDDTPDWNSPWDILPIGILPRSILQQPCRAGTVGVPMPDDAFRTMR